MGTSKNSHHGNLATMETDLSLGPAPAVADAASPTIMRRARGPLRVLAKHLLDGSEPGVRQKRSKELSTSCQAVLRLGTSASDEGVVIVVMALLSFADSTPRA
jgi:hypothetical protein